MAKTRSQKETDVQSLVDLINGSKLSVLTDYRGLDVPAINELRSKLREAGISYKVSKNTLVKIALDQSNKEVTDKSILAGPMAIAFGQDEVEAAKIVVAFAKTNEALQIIGAIGEDGSVLSPAEVKALAALPSKHELTAQVVGTIAAPLSGFVRVLNANLTGLVYALNAVAESKQN
ncbi:50S ribosomal protein L10 [bacterium]|nr:50S ribosomal protein L10 [bacterium]